MTEKAKANLIRLLKANNPASRNLGKVLLEKSDLSEEEQKQILTEANTIILHITYSQPMATTSFGESRTKEIWLKGKAFEHHSDKDENTGFFIPTWKNPYR